jgi:hypothetical protein
MAYNDRGEEPKSWNVTAMNELPVQPHGAVGNLNSRSSAYPFGDGPLKTRVTAHGAPRRCRRRTRTRCGVASDSLYLFAFVALTASPRLWIPHTVSSQFVRALGSLRLISWTQRKSHNAR